MSVLLGGLALIDHHCHGLVRRALDGAGFEALISEGGPPAEGASNFDTPVGVAVRRHCGPVLDLQPLAPAADYLTRRAALGTAEVTRRLLRATGTETFLVDTGFRAAELLSPAELADAGGASAREIVRLETVAEDLASQGVTAGGFRRQYADALAATVAGCTAVALKSVAAYRVGFDFDPRPPTDAEVATAAGHWLGHGPRPGTSGYRLDDPVLERALLWAAVDVALPLQFHVGYGDADIRLHRANPALLTDFLHLVPDRVPIALLHCYPYHREAGYLAAVHRNVHFDVGLALGYLGPVRAASVLAEALELAPFGKMLYSSDAFGVPELYYLGALAFRRGLTGVLQDRVASSEWSTEDSERVAQLITRGNAVRLYRL